MPEMALSAERLLRRPSFPVGVCHGVCGEVVESVGGLGWLRGVKRTGALYMARTQATRRG